MTICSNCGEEIPKESTFCPNCGLTIVEHAEPSPQVKGKKSSKPIRVVALISILIIIVSGFVILSRPSSVIVRIWCLNCKGYFDGVWSGELGTLEKSSSISGKGNKTYTFTRSSPFSEIIVMAAIQKVEVSASSAWRLVVTIETTKGDILAIASTVSEYGIITISWRG